MSPAGDKVPGHQPAHAVPDEDHRALGGELGPKAPPDSRRCGRSPGRWGSETPRSQSPRPPAGGPGPPRWCRARPGHGSAAPRPCRGDSGATRGWSPCQAGSGAICSGKPAVRSRSCTRSRSRRSSRGMVLRPADPEGGARRPGSRSASTSGPPQRRAAAGARTRRDPAHRVLGSPDARRAGVARPWPGPPTLRPVRGLGELLGGLGGAEQEPEPEDQARPPPPSGSAAGP